MRGKVLQGKNSKSFFIISLYQPSSSLQVNSILRNVATKLEYDSDQLENLYERTAWALEEKTGPASSYDMFKKAVV